MAFFTKRLTCFYCGCRSDQASGEHTRKWHCKHCDADNYLDENGEPTDPPVSVTSLHIEGPSASGTPFKSTSFNASGLFCSSCIRNQHMFTTMLASYLPVPDDPAYSDYEKTLPEYRRTLEERYPQVCADCEPRVRERIRQTGYDAKSDHLRRMIAQSKADRAAYNRRRRSWKHLLVLVGAVAYWISIIGQFAWSMLGALDTVYSKKLEDLESDWPALSIFMCTFNIMRLRGAPNHCSRDLASLAGFPLLTGLFSLWWNPKLRLRTEGRRGRLTGLGDYYKVQLIVMTTRCAFWAIIRDPSSNGLKRDLRAALHVFMIIFTLLSAVISRRIVKYDTAPLFSWTEPTPASTPTRREEVFYPPGNEDQTSSSTDGTVGQSSYRFPLEKLSTPPKPTRALQVPTPPAEVEDMDWTPSVQYDIRPTLCINQRDEKSVFDGPLPFYGPLPAAPQPPSWKLRNQSLQKPIEQVIQPNPFHNTATQSSLPWQRPPDDRDSVFAPPKFFPPADHVASTGLESLFDQAFTIRSPGEECEGNPKQGPKKMSSHPTAARVNMIPRCLRLSLLLLCLAAWFLFQGGYRQILFIYIEVISLGSAGLIAGFELLEAMKQPIPSWSWMEIMVYIIELAVIAHLGYNLSQAPFGRKYFDRHGKLLLVFMATQEVLGLLSSFKAVSTDVRSRQMQQPKQPELPDQETLRRSIMVKSRSDSRSQSSTPALSFSSTARESSFSTLPPEPQYQLDFLYPNQGLNKDHSFSLDSLKGVDHCVSDDDRDSDTETTMTTATTATNSTVRNIRHGRAFTSQELQYSPARTELGPGIGGLSLEDRPVRMTRSQTQQLRTGTRRYPFRRIR